MTAPPEFVSPTGDLAPTATRLAARARISDPPAKCKCAEQVRYCTCAKTEKRETLSQPTESILGKAHRLVHGKRGADYGHPLDNHGATARMFAAYLERKYGVALDLDADDTCWFNVFQKASRDANVPGEDNLTDVAGYVHNLELLRAERARRAG